MFSIAQKLTKSEVLASKCLKSPKSEICLLFFHGSVVLEIIPDVHRRNVLQLAVVDELYSALVLARPLKTKSTSTLEPELISTQSRSMESSCFAILVDHRSHRISAMLEPELKMAAEGSTLIHQASSFPYPSISLPSWHLSSSILHPMPQPPVVPLSTPPTTIHHTQSVIEVKRKLGFSFLGMSHFGPCFFSIWPIFKSGNQNPKPMRPRSVIISKSTISFVSPSRHNAMNCRRLLSRLVSILVQRLVDNFSTETKTMASDEPFRDAIILRYWTPASTSCHLLSLAEPKLLSTERLKLYSFSPVSHCAIHLPDPFTAASGSLWMNLRPFFGLLASHGFLSNFQTPRSFLSTLLLPIRHCLGSLVDLDVRRLHLRLRLPRMFGIYIGCARILGNAPFVTLFATSYHGKKQVCLNPLLVPSAPTCQLLPQGQRLGSDLNSQGQSDYKLCVEFLNLHGQRLHVREDPPALLRLVIHQMRFPVSLLQKPRALGNHLNH